MRIRHNHWGDEHWEKYANQSIGRRKGGDSEPKVANHA